MAWVQLDDQIPRHEKCLRAGPAACWLWVCGIAHCQSQLTDGFISNSVLPMIGGLGSPAKVQKLAAKLVAVGLFERADGGYRVHDYLEHNRSAAEVRADREWDRRRKEMYSDPDLVQAIRSRDQNRCRYCGCLVNWNDRRGPTGGQFDHLQPRGENSLQNIVVACRRCNSKKGNRPLDVCGLTLRPVPTQVRTSSDLGPIPASTNPIPALPSPSVPNSRSKHPIFKGQRFTVFDWQLEDLGRLLGDHTEAFDLHAWFYELDQQAVKSKDLIPQRDGGKWLEARTLEEAQRRGLIVGSQKPAAAAPDDTADIVKEIRRQDQAVRQ